MLRKSTRTTTLLALTLVTLLLVAACGDSDDGADIDANPSGAQPAPTTTPTITQANEPAQAMPTEDATALSDPTASDDPAAADTPAPDAEAVDLAPEFVALDSWHNSDPLALAELRGSPVLLVFWADF